MNYLKITLKLHNYIVKSNNYVREFARGLRGSLVTNLT